MISTYIPCRCCLNVLHFLCVLFLLACGISTASAEFGVDRAVWLERDPRLSKPVTIVRRHIRVGELIEEASRQTGVPLTTNRYDKGDSEVITVYARAVPLVDVLSNVWSLVSYQNAAWQWEVLGDGKKISYSYQLNRPVNAAEYAKTVHAEMEKHFEETMEASIEALTASPSRVAELKAKYAEVRLQTDPLEAAESKAFASMFSKKERLALARSNGEEKLIPREQWTKEMTQYTDASIARIKKLQAEIGVEYDEPYPDVLRVRKEQHGVGISPVLWFLVGEAGWPVVGSTTMDKYWQETLQDRWIVEGDTVKNDGREAVIVSNEPVRPRLEYRPTFEHPIFRQLDDFNKLTGTPVFARGADGFAFLPPYRKSVRSFVENLREQNLSVKWRGDALLIAHTNWISRTAEQADKQFPWLAMKTFRDAMIATGDYGFALSDVARLAHDTTDKQLEAIAPEEDLLAPNMFMPTQFFCEEVNKCRPMLAPIANKQELCDALQSPKGVRVRELPKEMREYLATQFTGIIPADFVLRIRTDVQNPQTHPEMWKDYPTTGLAMPFVFFFEVGRWGENVPMKTVGMVRWYTRKPAVLDAGRQDLEADLRLTTMRTYEPTDMSKLLQ